jgi:hypothetical protein
MYGRAFSFLGSPNFLKRARVIADDHTGRRIMRKLTFALASALELIAVAFVPLAWADDSGHAGPQSLKAEQSLHDGTAGTTTQNHTADDVVTTPGAGQPARPVRKDPMNQ